jgi:peptide/nickel transport system ATP-binding protein
MFAIEDLHVWFDSPNRHGEPAHTVKGVNLSVPPGGRLGLVGESGSGKTTTILAAMGLLPRTATVSGRIMLDGTDILAGGERSVAPHRWNDVAMVFQGAMNAFNPVKTVEWQIVEALQVHRVCRGRAARARARELLELVGVPARWGGRYPFELSGGMRQRAVIAMALACEPRVLLADEPTTALDVVVQNQVLQTLVRLADELALGLVLVTHDLAVVAQTCHRAAVMLDGEVVEQGTVEQLYRAPRHPYTRRLFEATPDLTAVRPASDPPPAEPLLEVRELQVRYETRGREQSDTPAVDRVSLHVDRGEMVALVGQSGCGKTTTLQCVLGMVPATSGSIRIAGEEVTALSRRQWRPLRRRVQLVYQDPYESLDVRFRVRQTLEEPLRIHRIGRTSAERRALVVEALERVGLTPPERYLQRYPHQLSGGQRQRVAIASALVLGPELLLADEPVSMLDVSVRTGILELIDALRR